MTLLTAQRKRQTDVFVLLNFRISYRRLNENDPTIEEVIDCLEFLTLSMTSDLFKVIAGQNRI